VAGTILFYDSFYNSVGKGDIAFVTDDIKLALYKPEFVFNASDTLYGDLTEEVSAPGYLSGGISMTGKTVGSIGLGVFNADDAIYPTSSYTTKGAVMYKDGATPAEKYLIAFFDFQEEITIRTNQLEIKWKDDGIFRFEFGGIE
jgi:hypothetical protein